MEKSNSIDDLGINIDVLRAKIEEYLEDERITYKEIPDKQHLSFGFDIKYPPKSTHPLHIAILKIKDKPAISIQSATQIAENHIKALEQLKRAPIFFYNAKKLLLAQNLSFNIDADKFRYIISDLIYPDGLNENNFYASIRKLFNISLLINMLLMEIIEGQRFIPNSKKINNTMDGFGNSMFT